MDNKINNEEEKIYYVKRIEKLESKYKIQSEQIRPLCLVIILNLAFRIILPDLYELCSADAIVGMAGICYSLNWIRTAYDLNKAAKELDKLEKIEETEEMEGKTK